MEHITTRIFIDKYIIPAMITNEFHSDLVMKQYTKRAEKFLRNNNTNLNLQPPKYYGAPIHYAAMIENNNFIKLLLKNGAFINLQTDNKETALHFAAELLNIKVVEVLIQNNIDINIRNKKDQTALDILLPRIKEYEAAIINMNNLDPNNQISKIYELLQQSKKTTMPPDMANLILAQNFLKKAKEIKNLLLAHGAIKTSPKNKNQLLNFVYKDQQNHHN